MAPTGELKPVDLKRGEWLVVRIRDLPFEFDLHVVHSFALVSYVGIYMLVLHWCVGVEEFGVYWFVGASVVFLRWHACVCVFVCLFTL